MPARLVYWTLRVLPYAAGAAAVATGAAISFDDNDWSKLVGPGLFGAGVAAVTVSFLQELVASQLNARRAKALRAAIDLRVSHMTQIAHEWKGALEQVDSLTIANWKRFSAEPRIRLHGTWEAIVAKLEALAPLVPTYQQAALIGLEDGVALALSQTTRDRKTSPADGRYHPLSTAGTIFEIDVLVEALSRLKAQT